MGTNGPNEVTMSTSDEVEDSDITVEIKIKTMDSQTHTLRVNKCVPVPALKEQVATVTGVLSEQQRLICRGKVLMDDQLLSAYHVEDGHTLHLVCRQPAPSSSASSASALGSEVASGHEALNSASTSAQNRGTRSLVFEAINVDQGDHSTSSLSRQILSSLLNTIAAASSGTGSSRSEFRETGPERPDNAPGNSGPSDVIHPQPSPAAPRVDVESRHAAFRIPSAVNLGFQQPVVIPDSLTTIHQFLGHIRDEFRREAFRDMAGEVENNAESSGIHVIAGQTPDFQFGQVPDGQGGLPSVASLSTLLLAARELLVEQAGGRLSQLARQLENQTHVLDPVVRTNIQSSAMRSGLLLQNLGSLLLELGRTTMTLRMGQTATEAVVNAGPAVYISSSGPNPMMVQPAPFHPGSSFGGVHTGTANSGHNLEGQPFGSAVLPGNIDIRIHAGHTIPVSLSNFGVQSNGQQTQEQTGVRTSTGANFIHQTISGASGSAPFRGETGVRVVPIRTVIAGVGHPPSDSSGRPMGLFYPLFSRTQQHNSGNVTAGGPEVDQRPIPGRDGNNIPTNPTLFASAMGSTRVGPTNPIRVAPMSPNGAAPTNATLVVTPMSPTMSPLRTGSTDPTRYGSDQYQVPSQNPSVVGTQASGSSQETVAEAITRFHQWMRSVPTGEGLGAGATGEELHADSTTYSPVNQTADTTRESPESQGESTVGENQAVFFSNLVRQLMPHLYRDPETVRYYSPTQPDSLNSPMEQANRENEAGPSNRRAPPEAPTPKRTKRD